MVVTPDSETLGEPGTPTGTVKRVLLVDDHVDTREMYAILLSGYGHVVHQASDAPAALATVCDTELDAAVIDIGLPGMDGYELARRIRGDTAYSHVALIAVTGHGLPEHRAQSRLAGFDVHLVKPVAVKELLAALDTWSPRVG